MSVGFWKAPASGTISSLWIRVEPCAQIPLLCRPRGAPETAVGAAQGPLSPPAVLGACGPIGGSGLEQMKGNQVLCSRTRGLRGLTQQWVDVLSPGSRRGAGGSSSGPRRGCLLNTACFKDRRIALI